MCKEDLSAHNKTPSPSDGPQPPAGRPSPNFLATNPTNNETMAELSLSFIFLICKSCHTCMSQSSLYCCNSYVSSISVSDMLDTWRLSTMWYVSREGVKSSHISLQIADHFPTCMTECTTQHHRWSWRYDTHPWLAETVLRYRSFAHTWGGIRGGIRRTNGGWTMSGSSQSNTPARLETRWHRKWGKPFFTYGTLTPKYMLVRLLSSHFVDEAQSSRSLSTPTKRPWCHNSHH